MESDYSTERGIHPDLDNIQDNAEIGSRGKASEEGGDGRARRGRPQSTCSPVTKLPITPLRDPQVGDVVWAKLKKSRWWPATLINKADCGTLPVSSTGGKGTNFYTFWYGDGRISPVRKTNLVGFKEGYPLFSRPYANGKNFQQAIHLAILDFGKLLGLDLDNDLAKALEWANAGFSCPPEIVKSPGVISKHVQEKLWKLRDKYEENSDSEKDDDSGQTLNVSRSSIEELNLFRSIQEGSTDINHICLACGSKASLFKEHPLFQGGICERCMEKLLELSYSVGIDNVAFHCCICLCVGDLIVCSQPHCYRAFCCKCIELKATSGVTETIRQCDPWSCFLCQPYTPEMHGLLQPRTAWKSNMWRLFHCDTVDMLRGVPLRILCCDDSCDAAFTVLSSLISMDLEVETLYLCNFNSNELTKLKQVSPKNVIHLGTASNYQSDEAALCEISAIHLVVFSCKEKETLLAGEKFFLFHSILSTLNIQNCFSLQPKVPLMWFFEVTSPNMHDYNILISRYMQFDHAEQSGKHGNEERSLVWTNIPSLWSSLEGAGVSPTLSKGMSRERRVKRRQPRTESGSNQTPTCLREGEENINLSKKRYKKRKLIMSTNPRVTRSMSIMSLKFSVNPVMLCDH